MKTVVSPTTGVEIKVSDDAVKRYEERGYVEKKAPAKTEKPAKTK